MHRNGRCFVILDYGASLSHTHHGRLIQSYLRLFEELAIDHAVFLPIGSKVHLKGQVAKIRKCLLPSHHPASLNWRSPTTIISSIWRRWLSLVSKQKLSDSRLLNLTRTLLVRSTWIHIKSLFDEYKYVHFIFPTACPASFWFATELLRMKKNTAECYLRLTNTAESRGPLSRHFHLKEEIGLIISEHTDKVHFAFETRQYAETFLTYLSSIEITPPPPVPLMTRQHSSYSSKDRPQQINVGFLGTTQDHKGIETLAFLVKESLTRSSGCLHWKIQISNSSTAHYFETKLHEFVVSEQLEIYKGFMHELDFDQFMSSLNVLILPYNPNSYRFSASALLYRALDHLIPCICFAGSAFATEVSNFDLGDVVSTREEMVQTISRLNSSWHCSKAKNIESYNLLRLQANKDFLGL